ncbi:DNA-binding response regulator [Salinicola sp. MH3R3-1]|uniref:response regulator transcription factor n=1 Tax=Salinicola TaxID=404432 RepID=UPI00094E16C3|nr:response regulator transcription factor [Salinicola sp. MH3R3-1]OLO06354.1 DNA-binding response regulator [Salinicola sp. MH3R3-1]
MRVMLVEDDPLLGEGVVDVLRREQMVPEWLTEGRGVCEALDDSTFDALILDLGLPDIDGFEVLKQLRESRSQIPVLVLTARDDVVNRIRGLDSGADDYLIKPFDNGELLARLRALVRRSAGRASPTVNCGRLTLDPAAHEIRFDHAVVALGRREHDLLAYLMTHPGQVFTRDQLVEVLYGWDAEVESNVIEVHVHHLRRKFGSDVVATVRNVGYRLGATD